MREPISRLHGIALPWLRDNVDTDELIPVFENTRVVTTGWGDGLFAGKRYLDGTGRELDPNFILNKAPFDRATILISGENFGCGSSRESAVWALRDYGFRIVLAISFNETFERNCIINGLAPLRVSGSDIRRLTGLVERDPERGLAIDLRRSLLAFGDLEQNGEVFPYHLDPFYTMLLTSGQSEEDLLVGLQPRIDARRTALLAASPWLGQGLL